MKRIRPTIEMGSIEHARSPSTVTDIRYFNPKDALMQYDEDPESTTHRLHVMIKQQSYYYEKSYNYLIAPKQSRLREWRQRICEWYYGVVDQTHHDRVVVPLSLNLMDRYLMRKFGVEKIDRRQYYLVAMTCLMLGSKLGATRLTRRSHISIGFLVYGSNKGYTVEEMEDLERDILIHLNWRLHPPLIPEFIHELFQLIPRWNGDLEWRKHSFHHAIYAAELSIISSDPIRSPVILAYVCVLTAIQTKQIPTIHESIFYQNVEFVLDLTPNMVTKKVTEVHQLIRNAHEASKT